MVIRNRDSAGGQPMTIAMVVDQIESGWIASAPEARALAQGSTREEAIDNLVSLLNTYPELLDDLRENAPPARREVELLAV